MDQKQRDVINALLNKASAAASAADAINFSQAACNAANAIRVLGDAERSDKGA